MWRIVTSLSAALVVVSVAMSGCEKESETKTRHKPGKPVKEEVTAPPSPTDAGEPTMPPGHPPITATMPANHPPIPSSMPPGLAMTRPASVGDSTLSFTAPDGWVQQKTRMMTTAVYSLPRAQGDSEDADLAVSSLGRFIPLDQNVARWCGQFEFPEGKGCADFTTQRAVEGTKYPATIIEIRGGYKAGSMMGAAGPAKPGYRMLVAEIRTPAKPWYVKMIGPEKTVAQWEASFLTFVRNAN